MSEKEKTCWKCKTIIVGDSKFGLCPKCINKYGSAGAAAAALGAGIGVNYIRKNKDKVITFVVEGIKSIKG